MISESCRNQIKAIILAHLISKYVVQLAQLAQLAAQRNEGDIDG